MLLGCQVAQLNLVQDISCTYFLIIASNVGKQFYDRFNSIWTTAKKSR